MKHVSWSWMPPTFKKVRKTVPIFVFSLCPSQTELLNFPTHSFTQQILLSRFIVPCIALGLSYTNINKVISRDTEAGLFYFLLSRLTSNSNVNTEQFEHKYFNLQKFPRFLQSLVLKWQYSKNSVLHRKYSLCSE